MISVRTRRTARSVATETDRRPNIRVDTTLVPISVEMTDPLSRFVTGLEKGDFRVFEDKVEQEIIHVSSEDAPLAVGIVLDTRGSMGAKLGMSRQAVNAISDDGEFGG